MLLMAVKQEDKWLQSRWHLSYHASWQNIIQAGVAVLEHYEKLQVLVDEQLVEVKNKEQLLNLEEAGRLTIRGISTILKVPISLTFYNQLEEVDVQVAMASDKFASADYEKFNKAIGQYLDSIEIAMHRRAD